MPFARSILFVGLAFSSLISAHLNPQTVFFSEWSCALGLVLAWAFVSWQREEGVGLRFGLPALSAGLLLVELPARPPLVSGLAYPLYLALFLVAYSMGQRWRLEGGEAWIASGLLLCALLQSLAGFGAVAGLEPGRSGHAEDLSGGMFGNIGQANHYTDLIFLVWLRCAICGPGRSFTGRFSWGWRPGCVWPQPRRLPGGLALHGGFCGARSVGALAARGRRKAGDAAKSLLLVAGLPALAQVLVTYGELLSAFGVTSSPWRGRPMRGRTVSVCSTGRRPGSVFRPSPGGERGRGFLQGFR